MKPVTAGVRVPVTITTDASQLPMGLQKVRAQLGGLGSRLSGSMMSGIGGMLSGWLGIQGALRGMQMISEEAERLQGLARKWDIGTIKEHAKTQVMQMQSEQVVAKAIGPIAQMEERRLQTEAALDASPMGQEQAAFAASLGMQGSEFWSGFKKSMTGWGMWLGGDTQGGNDMEALGKMEMMRSIGIEDWFESSGQAVLDRGREVERQALEAIARASAETSRNTRGNS